MRPCRLHHLQQAADGVAPVDERLLQRAPLLLGKLALDAEADEDLGGDLVGVRVRVGVVEFHTLTCK